jgi:hypothetical protein
MEDRFVRRKTVLGHVDSTNCYKSRGLIQEASFVLTWELGTLGAILTEGTALTGPTLMAEPLYVQRLSYYLKIRVVM